MKHIFATYPERDWFREFIDACFEQNLQDVKAIKELEDLKKIEKKADSQYLYFEEKFEPSLQDSLYGSKKFWRERYREQISIP